MQHTQNYQLPQWEMDDRIMMEDFNDMTEKIDAAIAGKVVCGEYAGSSVDKEINVGFRPKAVLIGGRALAFSSSGSGSCALFRDNPSSDIIEFTDTGFKVTAHDSSRYPSVNAHINQYYYVAFA